MTKVRRILYPVTAALILAYFLFFTWQSRLLYFDADDMNTLYFSWSKPLLQVVRENLLLWKGEYRPLTEVFYRGIFAVAGFNPLPFRFAALGFCTINLVVCFWFTRLISASERTAALATLLFAFQVQMLEAWFRTTVIADVLCFFFVYLAAGVYISARRSGGDLSGARIAIILLAYICALNSVEFAVCLPVFVVAWELLFNSPKPGAFLKSRAFVLIAVLVAMTLVYTYGKLHGPASMVNNPAYAPEYSYARFTATWNVYLKDLFVLADAPPGWISMTILGGMLAVALAARSRVLLFAWVVIIFGLLPVSFAPPRGGYEIYVSYLGWALYAAALLVVFQDLITRSAPRYRTAVACAVFVIVGWRVGKINLHGLRVEARPWLYDPPAAVRAMADQMLAMHPALPAHSSVLFLEDGFTTGEWTPLFIVRLIYRNPDMIVDRVKLKTERPPGWDQHISRGKVDYDYVFTYGDGRYLQMPPAVAGNIGTAAVR